MARSYYKLDLHTHSIASKDGGISEKQYSQILEGGILDYVAITDHDRIDFALHIQKKLGDKIIVGEEIKTLEGEVIGLFLQKVVPPKRSFAETVALIKEQNALVYIPHPFCHGRSGVSESGITPYIDQVDIIEHFNPRNILHSDNDHALQFAEKNHIPKAASSDAHCVRALGKTYSILSKEPTKKMLAQLLETATYKTSYTSFLHRLCPKKNTLIKKLGIQ